MLLGARQSLWRSGRLSAKSYVQEGLIAQWDGIENAGKGKHDPNAKVWKDLISGSVLSFDGNVIVEHNSMRFNKVGYSFAFGKIAVDGTERTVETVFEQSDTYGYQWFVSPYHIPTIYNTGGRVALNSPGGFDDSGVTILPRGSRSDIVRDGVGWDSFCDGVFKATIPSKGIRITSYSGEICIGNNREKTRGVRGKIHTVRIYNRALTPEEITHNYQIDKERFNLQ